MAQARRRLRSAERRGPQPGRAGGGRDPSCAISSSAVSAITGSSRCGRGRILQRPRVEAARCRHRRRRRRRRHGQQRGRRDRRLAAALGVLPLGTLNHFAKDAGIPLDLRKAVQTVAARHSKRVDVGARERSHLHQQFVDWRLSELRRGSRAAARSRDMRSGPRSRWQPPKCCGAMAKWRFGWRGRSREDWDCARRSSLSATTNTRRASCWAASTRLDAGRLYAYFAPPVPDAPPSEAVCQALFGRARRDHALESPGRNRAVGRHASDADDQRRVRRRAADACRRRFTIDRGPARCAVARARGLMPMRTIVHLSDLHFGRLDERIIAPLVERITAIHPDLIAVSGDLTQRARRRPVPAGIRVSRPPADSRRSSSLGITTFRCSTSRRGCSIHSADIAAGSAPTSSLRTSTTKSR